MKSTEEIAGKFLGKKVEGKSTYDKSFLVAVPRQENRTYLGYSDDKYPDGFDTWYGYEFTTLTESGLPVNRVIKIMYPSSSKYIVESKSLKLYLNTYAMTRLGSTRELALEKAREMIEQDLTELLGTTIAISFIDENSTQVRLFRYYNDLYDMVENVDDLSITEYNENKDLLTLEQDHLPHKYIHRYAFYSLKSNCRVTHQPDFGDIFIYYNSNVKISEESLIKYLCSFRNEYHFHEEIVECCFKRLSDILNPDDELIVTALYTRRGGIDINPCRYQNLSDEIVEIERLNALKEQGVFTRFAANIKQ